MNYEFAAAVLFLDDRGAGTLHKGSGEIADFPAEPELCDVRAGRVPFCQAGTRRCADKIWPCL